MRPLHRVFTIVSLLAIGACSPSASTPAPVGTGGSTPSSSGGSTPTSSGGAVGTGGMTTPGSGGVTAPSSGGATSSGGSIGSGGTVMSSGGAVGAGGTTAPTVAAVAGIANANGARLMDSFILFPCLSTAAQDCVTSNACPAANAAMPFEQQGLTSTEVFQIGGTPGAMYNLTIRVNGIAEAKYYSGGVRAAGNATLANSDPPNGVDTFYTGGTPVNFENYNVYKFITKNAAGTELAHYYINSFPMVATPYENHQTFPIAFTHDIPVVGGGTFTFYTADRNCRAIDNCGIGFRAAACQTADGRMVPNEPNLVMPTMYMGRTVASMNARNGAAQPFHSQIFHIVVMAVTPM
jgi:hypothetical protein